MITQVVEGRVKPEGVLLKGRGATLRQGRLLSTGQRSGSVTQSGRVNMSVWMIT